MKKLRSKLELLAVRDIIMARGNQRDKAREKNQKELSAQVKLPLCSPGPPSPPQQYFHSVSGTSLQLLVEKETDGSTEEEE